MAKQYILFFALILISFSIYAQNNKIGINGDTIGNLSQLDVFTMTTLPEIKKTKKTPVQLKVMNYGIHRCTLQGNAWQEDTENFQALLVETDQLVCGHKKYPAHFYSRVILDQRLSLNPETSNATFVKSGMEIFLIKTKNVQLMSPENVANDIVAK